MQAAAAEGGHAPADNMEVTAMDWQEDESAARGAGSYRDGIGGILQWQGTLHGWKNGSPFS